MKQNSKIILSLIVLVLIAGIAIWGPGGTMETDTTTTAISQYSDHSTLTPDEAGRYTSKDDVAAYLQIYGHLPANFITKNEAIALGWDSDTGNLWAVTDESSIGGDRFGNREGLLPEAPNRQWTECDINYNGGFRGAERLVFSNDGLIYYTNDHYQTFSEIK